MRAETATTPPTTGQQRSECEKCGHSREGVAAFNGVRRMLHMRPFPPSCSTRLEDDGDIQGPGMCPCRAAAHAEKLDGDLHQE